MPSLLCVPRICRTGGTVSAFVTCPLEVVKTRLQSSNSGFQHPGANSSKGHSSASASTVGSKGVPGGASGGPGASKKGSQQQHYHPQTTHNASWKGGSSSKLIMPDFAAPSRSVTTVPSTTTTFNVRFTGSSSSYINKTSSSHSRYNRSQSSGGGQQQQILRSSCRTQPGWFQTWAVNYFSTTAHVNQCVGVPPNRVQPTMGVFQCLRYDFPSF